MQQQTFDFDTEHRATREQEDRTRLIRPDRQITFPDAATHYDWGEPGHDRDTITVDRVTDSDDGPPHRFVIKRGDTVRAHMRQDAFHTGKVIGISHARGEVRVAYDSSCEKGGWWKVGQIYPAVEPEPTPTPNAVPLSSIIETLNEKNAPQNGWDAEHEVPETKPEPTESQVLSHLEASPGYRFCLSELHRNFGLESVDADDPLSNPVNRELKKLRDQGRIHVEEPRFGEPRFSVLNIPETAAELTLAHCPENLSGPEVRRLLSKNNWKIADFAERWGFTQKHVREVFDRGLSDRNSVRDWIEGALTEPTIVAPTVEQAPAATGTYSFAEFKELWKTRGKDLSFEQYRETFERLVASEEAIKAELAATFKAPQLKAIGSNLGDFNAKSNTKAQNTESIYRRMLSFFLLDGTVSFSMGESWEDAVKEKVRAVTEESYREYHEKMQADALEREQALADPQTLADFAKFVRVKGTDALTNDQMARWDSQHADLARERSAKNGPAKVVTQFESAELAEVQFSIKEGYHDRKECPLWIVQLGSRVEKDTFRELKTKASMLSGWYSSFKRGYEGFQFYSEDDATRFTELLSGDADREDILERRKERKEQTAAERLHELADTLIARAEETIESSNNALQNTARRAEQQSGIRGRAFADQALARTLHSVATALSEGQARYLDGIRHKTHLETLETVLHLSKWARMRAIRKAEGENEYGYGMRVQDEEEKPYSEDDIRFAEYPFPTIWKSHLQDAVLRCKSLRGAKQVAERMRKRIGRSADEMVSFETETDVEFLADFLGRAKAAGIDTQWMDASLEKYKRLQAANITELHTLRSALRELLPNRAEVRADDPVQVAERELIGKQLPGFFPTPPAVISLMLEHADIGPHHSVLEPSAGKGDIVAAIKLEQPDAQVTAIEMNRTLSDVLAAKNIEVEFGDFLQHSGSYDRICMNPPFERGNNSDIDHVRHAYSLLAEGGRLVSVMGSGALQRSDAKSERFRSWLDELGAEVIDLPDGAFAGKDAFRQTGVGTKLVVIDYVG